MNDANTNGSRRWYDHTKIIYSLAFVLYGIVAWAWAQQDSGMKEIENRLRSVEINDAARTADIKAIRAEQDAQRRMLERVDATTQELLRKIR